jgi:hypothetical protein
VPESTLLIEEQREDARDEGLRCWKSVPKKSWHLHYTRSQDQERETLIARGTDASPVFQVAPIAVCGSFFMPTPWIVAYETHLDLFVISI